MRISHVTETHIHADFASGARELAARTGAQLYLSDEGGPDWAYRFAADARAVLMRDGYRFMVGNVRLQARHTPGHTRITSYNVCYTKLLRARGDSSPGASRTTSSRA